MIEYESIAHLSKCALLNKPVYSFYKYDGSNLRFEWQSKRGFCKFGTRTQLIDEKTDVFGQGVTIFQDTIASEIIARLKNYYPKRVFNTFDKIVVFSEFFGDNSFAGNHEDSDVKRLKVFDVNLIKKGLISPKEFVDIFNDWEHSAELLYQGNLNQPYINSVKSSTTLAEGVICKAMLDGRVQMCKVKTDSWLGKIKEKFENWQDLV